MNGDSVPTIVLWPKRIRVTYAVARAKTPAWPRVPSIASTQTGRRAPARPSTFVRRIGEPSRVILRARAALGLAPGSDRILDHSPRPEATTAVTAAAAISQIASGGSRSLEAM